jgi:hypothetical protein
MWRLSRDQKRAIKAEIDASARLNQAKKLAAEAHEVSESKRQELKINGFTELFAMAWARKN